MTKRAILALADGTTFEGVSFGATGESTGEVVFNTSMSGYQEILTDPSYVGQMVCMTYPEQGNYGVTAADAESVDARPHATGYIVRHYAERPSNFRAEQSISEYLAAHGIVGISGLDTRRLTKHIRTVGAQMGVVATEGSAQALVARARALPGMEGQDLATLISTKERYEWRQGGADCWSDAERKDEAARFHVVAYDWGLKRAMLRLLAEKGCRVTVVPARTTAAETLALKPDGVFLTNGPGDPAAVVGGREAVAGLLGKVPVFGICLGHQILALAIGARTYKLKFGHRGANQPVKELDSGKVDITAQNHGFAVDDESLGKRARVTHVNLNDGTVEGIEVLDVPAFSVQYHPESSPGPHDARHLFGRFVAMMERRR
jgi:carbamoyl-phosphate synthase small subunit